MNQIYLSSTYSDLKGYRDAAYEILRKLSCRVVAMEDYVATDARPLDRCLGDVAQSDIYVGLFAWRYGYVPEADNPHRRSITELEYRKASELGIPCLIFLAQQDYPWPPTSMDAITDEGGQGGKPIGRLREELKKEKLVSFFTTPSHLAGELSVAVQKLLRADEAAEYRAMFSIQHGKSVVTTVVEPATIKADLVGRAGQLRDLKSRLLSETSPRPLALWGLPGVGKTALAIGIAGDLEVKRRFTDGLLRATLGRDADPDAHLESWAAFLGIASDALAQQQTPKGKRDLIRRRIGDRRFLLIADDVWDPGLASMFHVGGPRCAYILTTRLRKVAGRFGREGSIEVRELAEDDGLELLARYEPEIRSEPELARELVRGVGGLPLPLAIVGKYLRVNPDLSARSRLKQTLDRLLKAAETLEFPAAAPELADPGPWDDAPASVRAVLKISDDALDEAARAALRALSVLPPKPNTVSGEAAVALSGAAAETIETLVSYGLLEPIEFPTGPGRPAPQVRYTMNKVVASYGRGGLHGSADLEKMCKFYIDTACEGQHDLGRLDAEAINLQAALEAATELGLEADLIRGALAVGPLLRARGLYRQAESHLLQAYRAARARDEPLQVAEVARNLGLVTEKRGDYGAAERYLEEGLGLARGANREDEVYRFLHLLGVVAFNRADYPAARRFLEEGAGLARRHDDIGATVDILQRSGLVERSLGEFERSRSLVLQALELSRDPGEGDTDRARAVRLREKEASLLTDLAELAVIRHDFSAAGSFAREGLSIAKEVGDVERTSALVKILGVLESKIGNFPLAEKYLRRSLAVAQRIEHRWYISHFQYEWGKILLLQRKDSRALDAFHESLKIAREVGARDLEAFALFGLARVEAARGHAADAGRWGDQSLTLFKATGHFMTKKLETWHGQLAAPRQA